MKTAVSQMIKELQEQFPKEMGDMYERNQLLLEDIALRAKEMEQEQKIAFAKLHVQKALKAVENQMILSASTVKYWYLPETIK